MGKVAVITGATGGIGLSTARLFAQNGFTVYGIARKPYAGKDFCCYSADVCDFDAVRRILDDIYRKEGGIDVFINNAGIGIAGAAEDCTPEHTKKIADVNLTSVCVLSGMAVKYLKERKGRIINVSSVGGIMPLPYQAAYSATKAGVEVFTRALANEVKPYKMKAVCVLPGDTKTGFTDARVTDGENARARRSVAKMERDERGGKDPKCVAKVIYLCAVKKRPPLRVAVGFVSKAEVFLSRFLSVKALNRILYGMYGK